MPKDSALIPGYIPIGIHANHMEMTKFASADDPGYVAVCAELRRWIKDMGGMESDVLRNSGITSNALNSEYTRSGKRTGKKDLKGYDAT